MRQALNKCIKICHLVLTLLSKESLDSECNGYIVAIALVAIKPIHLAVLMPCLIN